MPFLTRRIASCASLAAVLLVAGGARAQEAAAWLPPGARAVVASDDIAGFWSRFAATRFYAALRAGRTDEGTDAWVRLLGRRAAIGFYGEQGEHPDVALAGELTDPAAARVVMGALEARMGSERKATFADDRHGDAALRIARDSTGTEFLAWTITDGRLVAGSSHARLVQTLDVGPGDPSVAADAEWREASERVAPAGIVAWVDLASVGETIGERAGPAQRIARALALGVSWAEQGLRGDAHLTLDPEAPPAIVSFLRGAAGPVRAPEVTPGGTLFLFTSAGFDARLAAAATAAGPRVGGFESETGVDVERDLLPAIGSEAALAVMGVDASFLFPVPRIAILLEARDEAALRGVMEKIEGWAAAELLAKRSIPISWAGESYQGVDIRYASTPLGENVEPSYAVADGYLVVGSGRQAVKTILDVRAGRATPLDEDASFAPIASFLPDRASGVFYADLTGILARVRELGVTIRPPGEGGALFDALEHAPRLGMWTEPDGETGIWWRGFLELR